MSSLRTQAARYGDSIRHMRSRQIVWRARRLVPPAVVAAGLSGSLPEWRGLAWGVGLDPAPQSGPKPSPHMTGTFAAVGCERKADASGLWTDAGDGLLFLFHLHAFTDLARYAAGSRSSDGEAFWTRILRDWLAHCDRPARVAWHPYPLSGRIISWCAALSAGDWSADLSGAMSRSLARQLRYLMRSIEFDIGGNHVLHNGAALVIGGVCLGNPSASARGLRVLERELPLQFLSDGGHEERSTSYHRALATELADVATVLERAGEEVPGSLVGATDRSRRWMVSIAGPYGDLPALNDSWDGPAIHASARSRPEVDDLTGTGHVVVRHASDQALFDVGPMAPEHLPAHGHADVLSFVLWADGSPVVIDPGAAAYAGPDRLRFRGTSAHSTVEVDGSDQCDLWGPFRAAFMPHVTRGAVERHGSALVLTASHDGYRRLPDPVRHVRTFVWLPCRGLVVVDRLVASERHHVASRVPLADGLSAAPGAPLPGGLRLRALGTFGTHAVASGRRAPYLGRTLPIEVAVMPAEVAPGELFGWSLLRDGSSAQLEGDLLRVEGADFEMALPLRGGACPGRST